MTPAILLMMAILPAQADSGVIFPASLPEQRADLALGQAADGRALARRFLCSNEQRYRRLLEQERRFAGFRQLFAERFGHGWRQGAADGQGQEPQPDDLGRRDDCRLRDSFEAGMADYENGLLAAQAQLGIPQP